MTLRILAGGGGAAAARDDDFNLVTTLLQGNGPNNGTNGFIANSSGDSYSITTSGTINQGTRSPFSAPAGYWSTFFDGASEYFKVNSHDDFAFGTGAYTIEMWVWKTSTGSQFFYEGRDGGDTGRLLFYVNSNNKLAAHIDGGSVGTIESSSGTFPLNQWVHIALTRNSTYGYMYQNGAQVATWSSDSVNIVKPSSDLYVGKYYAGGSYDFKGYISNLRVIKGTALYTSAFTPPTAPLTAVTNTKLLMCASNSMMEDRSGTSKVIRSYGGQEGYSFSPFARPAATAAYDAAVHGGSYSFDRGTPNYMQMNHANFAMGTGNFTIEGWVRFTKLTDHGIFHTTPSGIGSVNTSGPSLGISSSGNYWTIYSGQGQKTFNGTDAPVMYTWYHFALVRGTSSGVDNVLRLYINGVKAQESGGTNGWVDTTNYTGQYLTIGAYYSSTYALHGDLSNFRVIKGDQIYADNFTPPTAPVTNTGTNTRLLLQGTNAKIVDGSRNFNIFLNQNTHLDTSIKKFGTASIEINGHTAHEFLKAPPQMHYGNNFLHRILDIGIFTVEFWLYVDSYHGTYMDIVGVFNGVSSGWLIYQYGNNLDVYMNGSTLITGTRPSADAWHHIAMTRDGTTLRLFVDGSLHGSATTTGTGVSQTNNPLRIGDTGGGRNALDGYIDDFRITYGKARYTSNFTAPTEEFLAI